MCFDVIPKPHDPGHFLQERCHNGPQRVEHEYSEHGSGREKSRMAGSGRGQYTFLLLATMGNGCIASYV